MSEYDRKIDGIRSELLKEYKAEKYAVINPKLIEKDNYFKTLYLKMLCTVVQYDNTPSEMQILYLSRLLKGTDLKISIEECMRRAFDIGDLEFKEFISLMDNSPLKYYFALESLILIGIEGTKHKNIELVADLLEIFGIGKDDLNCLLLICKSVLEQNSKHYDEAKRTMSRIVHVINIEQYLYTNCVSKQLVGDIGKVYTSQGNKKDFQMGKSYSDEVITFQNMTIRLTQSVIFRKSKTVEFNNCNIISNINSRFKFYEVEKIIFNNCDISNFHDRIAEIKMCGNVVITNCIITNCGWTGGALEKGALFNMSGNENTSYFIFEKNQTERCYIKSNAYRSNPGATGVLISADKEIIKYKITDNLFVDCECRNNVSYHPAIIAGRASNSNIYASRNTVTGTVNKLFEYD